MKRRLQAVADWLEPDLFSGEVHFDGDLVVLMRATAQTKFHRSDGTIHSHVVRGEGNLGMEPARTRHEPQDLRSTMTDLVAAAEWPNTSELFMHASTYVTTYANTLRAHRSDVLGDGLKMAELADALVGVLFQSTWLQSRITQDPLPSVEQLRDFLYSFPGDWMSGLTGPQGTAATNILWDGIERRLRAIDHARSIR